MKSYDVPYVIRIKAASRELATAFGDELIQRGLADIINYGTNIQAKFRGWDDAEIRAKKRAPT